MKEYLVFNYGNDKTEYKAIDESEILYWELIGNCIILTIDDIKNLISILSIRDPSDTLPVLIKVYDKIKNDGFEILDEDELKELNTVLIKALITMSLSLNEKPKIFYKLLKKYTEYN